MIPSISDDELFARWRVHRDASAREELVQRNLSLARRLAARYPRASEPPDDLFQVACLGLINAIDRFDPDRGIAFKSFAVPTILGELKRHFRDKGWSVHLPRGLQEQALKIQDTERRLSSRTGRSPTVVEVAEYLEVELEQVIEAMEARQAQYAASLDAPIESGLEEPVTHYDLIGRPEEGYSLVETTASLTTAIRQLPTADRLILKLRFTDNLAQREIAAQIGVSQMQVSRILRRITDQLRQPTNVGADQTTQ